MPFLSIGNPVGPVLGRREYDAIDRGIRGSSYSNFPCRVRRWNLQPTDHFGRFRCRDQWNFGSLRNFRDERRVWNKWQYWDDRKFRNRQHLQYFRDKRHVGNRWQFRDDRKFWNQRDVWDVWNLWDQQHLRYFRNNGHIRVQRRLCTRRNRNLQHSNGFWQLGILGAGGTELRRLQSIPLQWLCLVDAVWDHLTLPEQRRNPVYY